MLHQEKADDFVIATGQSHSVHDFVVEVLHCLDLVKGRNIPEVVNEYVEVDPKLFRTGEIHDLRGDSTLARKALKWDPEVDFKGLVRMMVESDTVGAGTQTASMAKSGVA
jgi:GDPmannose 4,6-dehydratase